MRCPNPVRKKNHAPIQSELWVRIWMILVMDNGNVYDKTGHWRYRCHAVEMDIIRPCKSDLPAH